MVGDIGDQVGDSSEMDKEAGNGKATIARQSHLLLWCRGKS